MELDLQTINYYNREDKIIENYEDEKRLELLENFSKEKATWIREFRELWQGNTRFGIFGIPPNYRVDAQPRCRVTDVSGSDSGDC